jgi:Zn-dependent protease with chaperone function
VTEARRFEAEYYDGRTAAKRHVQVEVEGERVRIHGASMDLDLATSELTIHPRVGSMPLRITLPGGGLLLAQADAVAQALPIPRASGLAHRLESHLGVVFASLIGVVLAAWLAYSHGIPWAARAIAFNLPASIESDIATEGLKAMDRYVLKPSELTAGRKASVTRVFAGLSDKAEGAGRDARLEFRDGNWIGANAFALPGGVVVLTDQLAVMMPDDEMVAAVLAHELGHLQYRHGTRHILQDSFAGLLSVALFGDASALTSLAVAMPTTLLHNGYSRDFEREADQYSYALLRATGRSPRLMAAALAELERSSVNNAEGCPAPKSDAPADAAPETPPKPRKPRARSDMGYLSTHPDTGDRIRAAEEAAR